MLQLSFFHDIGIRNEKLTNAICSLPSLEILSVYEDSMINLPWLIILKEIRMIGWERSVPDMEAVAKSLTKLERLSFHEKRILPDWSQLKLFGSAAKMVLI